MTKKYSLESDDEVEACKLVYVWLGIVGSKLQITGDTGYPDRIFWLPGGKPLLIEFKKPGKEPTPKQLKIHDNLRKLGYEVQVHDNALDAFDAIINAVDSARLPKESVKVLTRARLRSTFLRSRIGKN